MDGDLLSIVLSIGLAVVILAAAGLVVVLAVIAGNWLLVLGMP